MEKISKEDLGTLWDTLAKKDQPKLWYDPKQFKDFNYK